MQPAAEKKKIMFLNFFRRRTAHVSYLFNAQYIDPKGLFVNLFNEVPSAAYITAINVREAYPFLKKLLHARTTDVYQHSHFNYDVKKLEFNVTFVVLNNDVLVEIGGDFVGFYYSQGNYGYIAELMDRLADYRIVKETNTKIGFATQHDVNKN